MLSLLASFAQEEIRSLSDNVKWGTRKRMQQGIPNGHFRVYGYRWEGDMLVPIPEEAAIVRRIFQNFLDGKSRLETEREFAAEGITTREGCRWVDSNIKVVLTNVTYTGNLLLQNRGGTTGMHGFIGERVQVSFSNARAVMQGQEKAYTLIDDNGMTDYLRGNTLIQQKKSRRWAGMR